VLRSGLREKLCLPVLAVVLAGPAAPVAAQDLELSWIPPVGSAVTGYYVFVAPIGPGPLVATPIDVGRPDPDQDGIVRVRIPDVPATGLRIEVSSYDADRNESARSNRVMLIRRSEYLEEPVWSTDYQSLPVGEAVFGFVDSGDLFTVLPQSASNLALHAPLTPGSLVSRLVESLSSLDGGSLLESYEVAGRMYLLPGTRNAGVGVTLPAAAPWIPGSIELVPGGLDELYAGFVLGPDATGVFRVQQRAAIPLSCAGSSSTGITAMAYRWYRFRLRYTEPQRRARVRAKVWREGLAEPASFAVDCWTDVLEASPTGVFAFYREGWGGVYWDDLELRPVRGWWQPPPIP